MNVARTTRVAFTKLCVVLTALAASISFAEERAPVSIPRLLDPATRAETLRDFLLRSDSRGMGEIFAGESIEDFKNRGPDEVQPFPLAGPPAGYIVSFGRSSLEPDGAAGKQRDLFSAGRIYTGHPRTLMVTDSRGFRGAVVVRADGTWDESLINESILMAMSKALFADFNADGKCDVAKQDSMGFKIAAVECESDVLEVAPLGEAENPSLRVEWNLRRKGGNPAEWWGCWFEDADGDGVFDVNLGPHRAGIAKAVVTLRWDKAASTWTATGLGPPNACRVQFGNDGNWSMDFEKALAAAALPALAEPPPTADPSGVQDGISADEYSRPWKSRSLAGLSHKALLDEMQGTSSPRNIALERILRERSLPPLWSTPPRKLATALIHAHREARAESSVWIGFDTGDDEKPPEKGLLSFLDGPSGCFAPGGAYVTEVFCDGENSFISRNISLFDWANTPLLRRQGEFRLRRESLSEAQARQIFATLWWLSRATLLNLDRSGGGQLGGSTSDGFATLRLTNNGHSGEWRALRVDRGWGRPLLGGTWGNPKGNEIVVNVAAWMFDEWLPSLLGVAETRTEDFITAVLGDFLAGHASYESADVAAIAAGESGSIALRPLLEKVVATLPNLSPNELRIQQIESEEKGWVLEFGREMAGDFATYQRDWTRKSPLEPEIFPAAPAVPSIPGLLDTPSVPDTGLGREPLKGPVFSAQELWLFEPLDTLRAEKSRIQSTEKKSESALRYLRRNAAEAIRKIDLWNDADGLEKWALESDEFALRRLLAIAPARAATVIRQVIPTAGNYERDELRETLLLLCGDGKVPIGSPETALAGQRAVRESDLAGLDWDPLHSGFSHWRLTEQWMRTVVPPSDPMRYSWPALNAKLFTLIKNGNPSNETCRALARRGPPGAWNALERSGSVGLMPLAILTSRQPVFQKKMRARLGDELKAANWTTDDASFAAWLADIRDVAPALEKVATSSAEDGEGSSAPIRRHMPRRILSLWLEPDAATRAKLLLAFAMGNAFDAEELPEAQRRLSRQFKDAWAKCKAEGKMNVREFVDWCEAHQRIPSGKLGFVRGLLPK